MRTPDELRRGDIIQRTFEVLQTRESPDGNIIVECRELDGGLYDICARPSKVFRVVDTASVRDVA